MTKNIIITVGLVLSLAGVTFCFIQSRKQFVYINLGKVYDEFQMSKDLKKEQERIMEARQNILDSIVYNINKTDTEIKSGTKDAARPERIADMKRELSYRKGQFDEENQRMSGEYYAKVMGRINQYVEEFGKEKKYSLILGANGQGSIMYAEDSKDITAEVIAYLNSRYNDKSR